MDDYLLSNSNTENAILDPERQRKARRYAHISRRLMLFELLLGAVYLISWLIFGWSISLRDWLTGYTTNEWLLVAAFAIIFGGITLVFQFPLSYYSGFILPHRFDQSNQTRKSWLLDQVKGLALSGIFGLIILEIVYLLLREAPQTWWLWLAVFLLLVNTILANLAPVIIFPIFYKFVPLSEDRSDLVERLIRLAERASTHLNGVYKFDMSSRTKSANAALVGLGNTRRVILGDTLLEEFSDDEIETVMAHELGHHVHHDLPIGILVESVITLIGLYLASLVLNWGTTYFGFSGPGDIANLPLLGIILSLYSLLTMPLSNAYSRWRERLADQYALEATHMGVAYASALTRLANQNLAQVDPEPWVEFLLYSHPTLSKRIDMAMNYADQPNSSG